MNRIHVEDFDLSSTLESGQMFRYVRMGEGYLVHQRNKVFRVYQRFRELYFDGAEGGFITHYFGLDEDYGQIMRTLGDEMSVKSALECHWGLRILRQDPWECLISFLCSSAKNIAHIKAIVESLCRAFGDPVSIGNYEGHAFPREGAIDDLKRLRAIGLGFRAKYVHEANRIVGSGYFERIAGRPYGEARTMLMNLPGVGVKIADCVLLFSMGYTEAFPVDTWIKRGMEETYFEGKKTTTRRTSAFARERFGPFAGYAQQYLYHYWREKARLASGVRRQESEGRMKTGSERTS